VIPVQLDEIRQIEVVEGPNSALFEFNAASGVINNITYDALFDQVNTATMRFGSQALLQGSAVATAHIGDNVGVRMSVGGLEQHEFEGDVSPSVVLPPLHNPALAVFNIDSKVRVAPGMEVTLEASSATSQLDEVGLNTLELYDTYRTNSFKAGVMADTAWGTIAVNAYRNREGVDANVLGVSTSLSNTVYVLQASDTLNLNADHTIRMSLEYRNNTLNSPALIGGGVGYAVYSASGRWDWQITPALSFTNSVRIDYLALDHSGMLLAGTGFTNTDYDNTTIAQPGFNSGLVYKVTDQDTVRLTAGRGLQVPSLIDFALQEPGTAVSPVAFVGSPTLQPTAVWNLELGYDRGIQAIMSTVRTSVFIQRNDNIITSGLSTLPRVLPSGLLASVAQNTGYSDAVGGELGLKGQSAAGFRWNASYTFELISDHTTLNQVALTSPQNYQDGTPTSVVILGGGYTRDKLELDAQGRWQSRFTDYDYTVRGLAPVYVKDYLTLMARVGYNLTDHVTVALVGQQLNVSRLIESAGPPVERSVIGSVTVHF
jgi:iron complex outermembrane receptor protein